MANNRIIQMIGANHTGKTTLTKRFISDWKSVRPDIITDRNSKNYGQKKYQVIAFDPKLQFQGLVDQYIYPDFHWAQKIVDKKIRNALIILDDYKTLIPEYKATPGMYDLFAGRWHWNIDFIISCHSPGHLLEMILDYITEYYIFHIKASEGKFKEKMANSQELIRISRTINRYTAIYGLGLHPNHPDFLKPPNNGQTFPYGVLNTTKPYAIPDFYNIRKDFQI